MAQAQNPGNPTPADRETGDEQDVTQVDQPTQQPRPAATPRAQQATPPPTQQLDEVQDPGNGLVKGIMAMFAILMLLIIGIGCLVWFKSGSTTVNGATVQDIREMVRPDFQQLNRNQATLLEGQGTIGQRMNDRFDRIDAALAGMNQSGNTQQNMQPGNQPQLNVGGLLIDQPNNSQQLEQPANRSGFIIVPMGQGGRMQFPEGTLPLTLTDPRGLNNAVQPGQQTDWQAYRTQTDQRLDTLGQQLEGHGREISAIKGQVDGLQTTVGQIVEMQAQMNSTMQGIRNVLVPNPTPTPVPPTPTQTPAPTDNQ